jgi:hypothetical protein
MTGQQHDPMHEQDADEAEQAKAAKRVQREVEDLKWLMKDARGRRFVARLLDKTGVHRTSFHTSGSVMAFNEGRRDVGLFLTGELLTHAPNAYFQLLNEYRNDD